MGWARNYFVFYIKLARERLLDGIRLVITIDINRIVEYTRDKKKEGDNVGIEIVMWEDWEEISINGELKYEGHGIDIEELLKMLQKYISLPITFKYKEMDE